MRWKLGQKEVLKPVAQTMISTSYIFPSRVCNPFSEILVISSETTSVFSATKASRYPCPGVNLQSDPIHNQTQTQTQCRHRKTSGGFQGGSYLLQPTPKFGIKTLQSLSSPPN